MQFMGALWTLSSARCLLHRCHGPRRPELLQPVLPPKSSPNPRHRLGRLGCHPHV